MFLTGWRSLWHILDNSTANRVAGAQRFKHDDAEGLKGHRLLARKMRQRLGLFIKCNSSLSLGLGSSDHQRTWRLAIRDGTFEKDGEKSQLLA